MQSVQCMPIGAHVKRPLSMWSPLAHSFFSIYYFFFLSFFSKAELAPSLVLMAPVARCSTISPTLGLLCLMTPKANGVVSVSPSVSRQSGSTKCAIGVVLIFSGIACSSSFNLNLKMVSDQKYPRVHTIQRTCSCFY